LLGIRKLFPVRISSTLAVFAEIGIAVKLTDSAKVRVIIIAVNFFIVLLLVILFAGSLFSI